MNIDHTNSYNIRDIIRAFANRERYQEIASRTGDLSFINICLDLDITAHTTTNIVTIIYRNSCIAISIPIVDSIKLKVLFIIFLLIKQ